jgi:hypothetical protein
VRILGGGEPAHIQNYLDSILLKYLLELIRLPVAGPEGEDAH